MLGGCQLALTPCPFFMQVYEQVAHSRNRLSQQLSAKNQYIRTLEVRLNSLIWHCLVIGGRWNNLIKLKAVTRSSLGQSWQRRLALVPVGGLAGSRACRNDAVYASQADVILGGIVQEDLEARNECICESHAALKRVASELVTIHTHLFPTV